MIVRMTKYSFVVLSQELDSFLLKLQELGMMDITRSVRPVDQNSREMVELSTRYKAAISMLKRVAKECEGITPVETPTTDDLLLQNVEKVFAAKDEAVGTRNQLLRDIQESEVWGEFSHKDIERLQQIGLQPHFYAVSPKRYQESWKEEYPLQILNATANKIYFTIVAPTGEEVPFPIQEAQFPAQPASILRGELKEIEAKIDNLKGQIAYFVNETDRLQSIHEAHLGKLDLYLANVASVKEGEDTISVLEGFAPTTEDGAICEFLDSTSALYITEKATQEDNPPVKLKNNWFARAFEKSSP